MFGGFIVILLTMAIASTIGKKVVNDIFSSSKPTQQEIEAKLIEGFTIAANNYRSELPLMVDSGTRLDNVTVGPGTRLVYHYTLIKYSSRDIDANQLLSELQPQVVNSVCSSKEMKPSLQYGGSYVYSYSGSDGIQIASFEIDRTDCGYPRLFP